MTLDWGRVASLVADGVGVAAEDRVSVFFTDVSAIDAVAAFVDECYCRGATPQVVSTDERFDASALRWATPEQLSSPPPLEAAAMEWSDVHVSFRAMTDPASGAEPERVAMLRRGRGLVSTMRWQGTRWALVRIPGPVWASAMSLDPKTIMSEWIRSFDADWDDAARRMNEVCDLLNSSRVVVVEDQFGVLELGVEGRTWICFSGEANWPDGELSIAPNELEVNGRIRFPGKFAFGGVIIRDLQFDIEGGSIVGETAKEGLRFVQQILDTDAGSRRIGEFGLGTNSALKTLTGDLLIDEKVLGTVHIAPGRAYPASGGTNQSALHWDIVKDLRSSSLGPGGSIRCDETWLIRDGVIQDLLLGCAVPPVVGV